MVAKKKSKKSPKRPRSGDPITVGGGSRKGRLRVPVFITFADAKYPDPMGGTKKRKVYSHTFGAVMKSLVVTINGTEINLTPLVSDPLDDETEVTIKGKGSSEDIVVSSNPMRVSLHTGKYPPEAGNKHDSPDATNFIKAVIVDSPLGSFDINLTATDSVEVVADTV